MVGIKYFEMPSCCNSCSHWSFKRDDEPLCDLTYEYIRQFDKRQDDCPLVEAIPKADYESRLNAEKIAMLKELKSEIEELNPPEAYKSNYTSAYLGAMAMKEKDKAIIQRKINALKGEK